MATAVTTILDDDVLARLDAIGDGRSRATVIADAIRCYLAEGEELDAFLAAGERSIDRGRFQTQEQMEAWVDARYPVSVKG